MHNNYLISPLKLPTFKLGFRVILSARGLISCFRFDNTFVTFGRYKFSFHILRCIYMYIYVLLLVLVLM